MIEDLLKPEVLAFILEHEHDDSSQLVLKHKQIGGVPAGTIADQINGRQKAKVKLPSFYKHPKIFYPPGLNLEQSSSETTAKFKADFLSEILPDDLRQTAADVTGGFGIDSYFLSLVFGKVHYVEPNQSLLSIARHNHQELGACNLTYHHATAAQFLESQDTSDLIYIDPSRRLKDKKVFSLKACEPDITQLQDEIFKLTRFLLVKTSPLLDLLVGIKEINFVKTVLVVAVNNECKEVLFFAERNFNGEPVITAVNITEQSTDTFAFTFTQEKQVQIETGNVEQYVYEPNAAILKAGAFKLLTKEFGLKKLHVNTHLYTSSNLYPDFPGRIFNVITLVKPEPKALRAIFTEGKANVITRNYPLSVDALKKKTGIKDGGDNYLIGCSTGKEKILIAATRIK